MASANNRTALMMKTEVTGTGKPLVLVPGGLTGWLSWKPHTDELAQHYRVIRVQLLSVDYGLRAEPLPAEYSLRMESEALTNTLDDLGVQTADFAAWSYGAEATLDFALNHPDRVRSLTLIEPPAFWVLRDQNRMGPEALAFQEHLQQFGPGEVTEEQLVLFLQAAGLTPPGLNPRDLPQWSVWTHHRQSLRTGDVPFRHEDSLERVRQGRTKPSRSSGGTRASASRMVWLR